MTTLWVASCDSELDAVSDWCVRSKASPPLFRRGRATTGFPDSGALPPDRGSEAPER